MIENEKHDFAADVTINRFKLEEECAKQPSLYHYWAEKLADAKSAVDAAYNNVKLVTAQREMYHRQLAANAQVKTTEATIAATVETDEQVQEAKSLYQQAQSTQYHLEAGVKALDHRKSELDNLTQLWIKSYYSRPDGGKGSVGDDVSNEIRKNLNKQE